MYDAPAMQSAYVVTKMILAVMLYDQYSASAFERRASSEEGDDRGIVCLIRRIEESYLPHHTLAQSSAAKKLKRPAQYYLGLILRYFAAFKIRLYKAAHLRGAFDECDMLCAARQSFDADCA